MPSKPFQNRKKRASRYSRLCGPHVDAIPPDDGVSCSHNYQAGLVSSFLFQSNRRSGMKEVSIWFHPYFEPRFVWSALSLTPTTPTLSLLVPTKWCFCIQFSARQPISAGYGTTLPNIYHEDMPSGTPYQLKCKSSSAPHHWITWDLFDSTTETAC